MSSRPDRHFPPTERNDDVVHLKAHWCHTNMSDLCWYLFGKNLPFVFLLKTPYWWMPSHSQDHHSESSLFFCWYGWNCVLENAKGKGACQRRGCACSTWLPHQQHSTGVTDGQSLCAAFEWQVGGTLGQGQGSLPVHSFCSDNNDTHKTTRRQKKKKELRIANPALAWRQRLWKMCNSTPVSTTKQQWIKALATPNASAAIFGFFFFFFFSISQNRSRCRDPPSVWPQHQKRPAQHNRGAAQRTRSVWPGLNVYMNMQGKNLNQGWMAK